MASSAPRHRKPASPRRSSPKPQLALLGVIAIGAVAILLLRQPPVAPAPAPSTPPPAAASTNRPAPAPGESPYDVLAGRWLRPDGGYLLVIDRVNPDGSATAGYFNPQPIHVAKARASREGTLLRFFLELQDVNYPGSTYTLTFDPASNELRGEYFQAALKQTFEVTFVRPQ